MKQMLLAIVLMSCVTPAAFGQTEGRIGVGGSLNSNSTTDDEVSVGTGFGVLVLLNPEAGWGLTGAFNWFKADLLNPSGLSDDFATLRVRPLLGGVSYTIGQGRILTSLSLVGGPSFNSAKFDDAFIRSDAAAIDADTSFAVRPGVAVRYVLGPRAAMVGFGGYLINRPGIVYRDTVGNEFRNRWRADAIVISVGAIYSIF